MTTVDLGSCTFTLELTNQRLFVHGKPVACMVDYDRQLVRVRRDLTSAQIARAVRSALMRASQRIGDGADDGAGPAAEAVSFLEVIRARRTVGRSPVDAEVSGNDPVDDAMHRLGVYCSAMGEMYDMMRRAMLAERDAAGRILDQLVSRLGQWTGADRSYFFRYDMRRGLQINTHEWCGRGIEPQIEMLQHVPLSATPMMNRVMWAGRPLRLRNVAEDIPNEYSDERDLLLDQHIQSLVTIPAYAGRRLAGFVGLDSVRSERFWSEHDVDLLSVVAQVAAALSIGDSPN